MIEISDKDYVRTITLNDPASFNSITEESANALLDALRAAVADDKIRAVLLTGNGKFFCAGGNLKNFMAQEGPLDAYVNKAIEDTYNPLAEYMMAMPIPVVSAINGPAIGAGVGLGLNADIVLAAKSAYFSLPFVPKLGVVPDMGCSWLVTRGLNYNQALALFLTGEALSAEDAARSGMIWKCVDDDALMTEASVLAANLAKLAPAAIRRTKESLRSACESSFSTQLKLEQQLQTASFGTKAFQEGLRSFKERREADFIAHGDD
ncbi:MAG: 2-(1,2-epoxy-1,2-dihydrophenyl)acetyl-CoA isomerase [Zhongshania sp.]|jgi:2-(1,2-epoxy-1,2-dihydrophenyl)acetyl-CoA isomerase|nr:enoyl-CoA hydratase/isomerase family protein [Zhongshania sp.]